MYEYEGFGLRIHSEFRLPELRPTSTHGYADVTIAECELTDTWQRAEKRSDFYAFPDHDSFLLQVPETAIFSVTAGTDIRISRMPEADDRKVRLYLLGTCMGALLMQRKVLPLHGSAIEIGGKAYAIVGDSGAGKSTLAAAMLSRGYKLLTDDVIAVKLDEDKRPYICPAYPQQKLWEESLSRLGLRSSSYSRIYDEKYAVPVRDSFAKGNVPLAGIFELVKDEAEKPSILPITGLERIPLLQYHTYRSFLLKPFGLEQWHFGMAAAVLGACSVYRLERPIGEFTVHQLVEFIERRVRDGVTIA